MFFLDADDIYQPNYVEQALEVYNRDRSFDFVFCGRQLFGDQNSLELKFAEDRDLGYSVIVVSYLREWIGALTSCLSMRRRVLEKILPLPFDEEWRIRADDCLVFGASLIGARKYYLAQPLVRYRVHSGNHWHGRVPDKFAVYRRRLAINSLFEYLERQCGYDVRRLTDFHHREFRTIARPTFRQLTQYLRINFASRISLLRRLACVAEIAGHFLLTAVCSVQSSRTVASSSMEREITLPLKAFAPAQPAANLAERPPRRNQRKAA